MNRKGLYGNERHSEASYKEDMAKTVGQAKSDSVKRDSIPFHLLPNNRRFGIVNSSYYQSTNQATPRSGVSYYNTVEDYRTDSMNNFPQDPALSTVSGERYYPSFKALAENNRGVPLYIPVFNRGMVIFNPTDNDTTTPFAKDPNFP